MRIRHLGVAFLAALAVLLGLAGPAAATDHTFYLSTHHNSSGWVPYSETCYTGTNNDYRDAGDAASTVVCSGIWYINSVSMGISNTDYYLKTTVTPTSSDGTTIWLDGQSYWSRVYDGEQSAWEGDQNYSCGTLWTGSGSHPCPTGTTGAYLYIDSTAGTCTYTDTTSPWYVEMYSQEFYVDNNPPANPSWTWLPISYYSPTITFVDSAPC